MPRVYRNIVEHKVSKGRKVVQSVCEFFCADMQVVEAKHLQALARLGCVPEATEYFWDRVCVV
jgi:hypothetical protein